MLNSKALYCGRSGINHETISDRYIKVVNNIDLSKYYHVIENFNIPSIIFNHIKQTCLNVKYDNNETTISKTFCDNLHDDIEYIMDYYNPLYLSTYFHVPSGNGTHQNTNLIYMIIHMQSGNEEFANLRKNIFVDVNVEWLFNKDGLHHCNLLVDKSFDPIYQLFKDDLEDNIKNLTESPLNEIWLEDWDNIINPNWIYIV